MIRTAKTKSSTVVLLTQTWRHVRSYGTSTQINIDINTCSLYGYGVNSWQTSIRSLYGYGFNFDFWERTTCTIYEPQLKTCYLTNHSTV